MEISLFFNFLIFFLSMACADHAFMDYTSVREIMDAAENIQNNNNKKIIIKFKFRLEIEDILIFQPYNKQAVEDSTSQFYKVNSFNKKLIELRYCAGYIENITRCVCR